MNGSIMLRPGKDHRYERCSVLVRHSSLWVKYAMPNVNFACGHQCKPSSVFVTRYRFWVRNAIPNINFASGQVRIAGAKLKTSHCASDRGPRYRHCRECIGSICSLAPADAYPTKTIEANEYLWGSRASGSWT